MDTGPQKNKMKSDPIQSELLKSSTNPIRTRSGWIGSDSDRTPLMPTPNPRTGMLWERDCANK